MESKELQFIDRNIKIGLLTQNFLKPFLVEAFKVSQDPFLQQYLPIEHSYLVEREFLEKLFLAHAHIGDPEYVTLVLQLF